MATKSLNFKIASFGGIGLIPVAPGTAGSAAGLLIWLLITALISGTVSIIVQLLLLAIIIPVGIYVSSNVEAETGVIDPKEIVIDEVAGILITLFALNLTLLNIIAGFILFRLFDIFKPYPISKLQDLKGGWGIMADDIAAGLISALILNLYHICL